jgi:ABC-type Mn2+/Zn2+ transport system permease subunit
VEEGAGMMNPLQFEFMREAFVVGCLIASACAVLSCFLVLRGWALMGDAISHAVLPGIVLSYWLGLPLGVGAFGLLAEVLHQLDCASD